MQLQRYLLLSVLIVFITAASIAQSQNSEKLDYSLYGEFNTIYLANAATFNYESHWLSSKNGGFRLNARLGASLGMISEEEIGDTVTGRHGFALGLVGFSMIWGKKNHHFVTSFGVIAGHSFGLAAEGFGFPLLEMGWRYQPPEGGRIWKISVGTNGLALGIGQTF